MYLYDQISTVQLRNKVLTLLSLCHCDHVSFSQESGYVYRVG